MTDPTADLADVDVPAAPESSGADLAPPDGVAWDLLVLGGGTAGLTAAQTAARLGASVLMIERERTGGDCLWTGCVPSKALLAAAHAAADARTASRYGVQATVWVDFPAVMNHVYGAIAAVAPDDSPATLAAAGVRVRAGTARLTGADTADVDGYPVRFRQAVLATGSEPGLPDLPGLADVHPLTSKNVWQLTELPARLLVLGGGPIGCELGQAFAQLGAAVTLVQSGSRVLAKEDPEAADLIAQALRTAGVDLRCGTTLTSVEPVGTGGRATLSDGQTVDFDRILIGAGRTPRTADLGAGAGGVELTERGFIRVDDMLRTTNPRIWAAGDLTGHPPFTHTAGVHGSLVASNAILGLRRSVDDATQPRVTFTQPEVAAFGPATPPPGGRVVTVDANEVDRARAVKSTAGFTRLVLDHRGRIVGATLVGPRAGECLSEVVLAATHQISARALAGVTHAYPAWTDGVWKAGIADLQRWLGRPPVSAVIPLLAGLRRRWVSRP